MANVEKKLKRLWRKMSKNAHLKDCKDKSCEICKEIRHAVNQDAPFYACLVVFNPTGDLILLGKRNKDDIWTMPGGHAYKGESPKQAALREAFEETGITFNADALIELPSQQTYAGKPAHAFMVFSPTHEEPIVTNDPDRELKEWKWFGMDENLPEPMDENRTRTVMNAKMKLSGLIKSLQNKLSLESLHKAIVLNENIPGVDLNTSEFSMDAAASKENPLVGRIKEHFSGMKMGDIPREMDLGTHKLCLSHVDSGIYSGWVKNYNSGDVVLRLEKMPVASIVQALEAKELEGMTKEPEQSVPALNIVPSELEAVGPQPVEETEEQFEETEEQFEEMNAMEDEQSEDGDLSHLLDKLQNTQAKHIHIHIHKSLSDLKDSLNS